MLAIIFRKSQKGSPTNKIIVEASGEKLQTPNIYRKTVYAYLVVDSCKNTNMHYSFLESKRMVMLELTYLPRVSGWTFAGRRTHRGAPWGSPLVSHRTTCSGPLCPASTVCTLCVRAQHTWGRRREWREYSTRHKQKIYDVHSVVE